MCSGGSEQQKANQQHPEEKCLTQHHSLTGTGDKILLSESATHCLAPDLTQPAFPSLSPRAYKVSMEGRANPSDLDMAIPSMTSFCWDVVQARGLLTKPFSRLFTQNLSQASSQVTVNNLTCFSSLRLSRSACPNVVDAVRAVGASSPEDLTFGYSKSAAHPPASSNGHRELPSSPWG